MKIGVVGGGYSGIILALLTKRKHPLWDVFLFEHTNKLGKKLSMTGSGRCNLGNREVNKYSYNSQLAYDVYNNCPLDIQLEILHDFGILTTEIGQYVYPHSLSAKQYLDNLENLLSTLGVRVLKEYELTKYNYNDNFIDLSFTNGITMRVEKLVFATGGVSFSKTGSDGSIFPILKEHGYSVTPLKPGLNGIITIEDTKSIVNERLRGVVTLIDNGKTYYKEEGEVIFKKDGLNGICVMNCQSMINRLGLKNPVLSFDIIPMYTVEETLDYINDHYDSIRKDFLKGLYPTPISNYLRKRVKDEKSSCIAFILKNLTFTYKNDRPIDEASCTIGGLDTRQLSGLQSVTENNVYFVGEMLNIDGLCGGYNLMLSFASAYTVAELF